MKQLLKKLLYNKTTAKWQMPVWIWLHNQAYTQISGNAVRLHNGKHPKHEIIDYSQYFLDNIDPTDTVIDIGCGNGMNAARIASKAKSVTGIDISRNSIEYAKEHSYGDNLEFIHGDATTYAFVEKYDKAILSNVLEHIDDRVTFLQKVSKLADEILIRVPLITRDWLAVYKQQQGYEYRLDTTHFIEYTEGSLRKELETAGLKAGEMRIAFG
jgi:2-polyprenyl-3-methyl-5-hydroxy-6-metoxy-1,4-benzoquinol methylase